MYFHNESQIMCLVECIRDQFYNYNIFENHLAGNLNLVLSMIAILMNPLEIQSSHSIEDDIQDEHKGDIEAKHIYIKNKTKIIPDYL